MIDGMMQFSVHHENDKEEKEDVEEPHHADDNCISQSEDQHFPHFLKRLVQLRRCSMSSLLKAHGSRQLCEFQEPWSGYHTNCVYFDFQRRVLIHE